MHGDFSRWPLDVDNIVGPLGQQGRVWLDTQQNAGTSAIRRWQDETARAAFGHLVAAVPSWEPNAFKIERAEIKPDASGVNQVFVTLDPGFLWADGIFALLRADANVQTASRIATYLEPPLQPVPPNPGAAGTRDAVVLEVWRAALSGFQDPSLLEPALGGPDTCELMQTQMAFRLFRMGPNDTCENIRDRIQDDFASRGKLTVTLAPTTTTGGDCPTVQGGGYSGFEHNLYRIEIAELGGGQPVSFKWSQFNGGLVGTGIFDASTTPPTVTVIGNNSAINTSGLTDCYVEAFDFDPQLGRWKLVYAAPATLGNDDTISLQTPTFGAIPGGNQPRFFRLWNGLRPITDFPATANPPNELRDGIRLQFDAATGAPNYIPRDYWTFAVRAGDIGNPQTLVDRQPPIGVHHHRVPLGVLRWTGGTPITAPGQIDDCRTVFPPLGERDCCCTVTVGDGLHSRGDFLRIRDALAALPSEGGRVCVLSGKYTENVTMQDLTNVTVSGCGVHTEVRSAPPSGEFTSADPVFHVIGGSGITLESMKIVADPTGIGILLEDDVGNVDGGGFAPLVDVIVQGLDVSAALATGIEMRSGTQVRIRECNVVMQDVEGMWPAIMVAGQDIIIERNRVTVEAERVILTRAISEVGMDTGRSALAGLGGIWLRGGCRIVRVLSNWIERGIGNGITLGSADVVQIESPPPGFFGGLVGWFYGTDACGSCDPGGTYVPPSDGGGDGGGPNYIAGPPLIDIVIEDNIILEMGLDGIGVFAFFGDLDQQGIITVRFLRIAANQIIACLLRQLAPTPDQAQGQVGYGGIALADVENAIITDNLIWNNGRDYLQPVCGIFLFHAVDVAIEHNEIADNGRKTDQNPSGARPGPRGGIWVTLATERLVRVTVNEEVRTVADGLLALRVHGNRVQAPLGRALTVEIALGPASVVDNRLCSRGVSPTWDGNLSSTVWIFNVGIDRELARSNNFNLSAAADARTPLSTNIAAAIGPLLSPDGYVLVADNQVALEVVEAQRRLLASIMIVTLDDLAFSQNQCECFFARGGTVTTHLLTFALSMRCQGNRFKEGVSNATVSALNIGWLADVTTGNVSTHCQIVLPATPPRGIKAGNVELIGGCDRLNAAVFSDKFVAEMN
jgi:hypothetical protein